MAYCDTCQFWNERINEFRLDYDDEIIIGDKSKPPKYCIMYDDRIPEAITYNNAECEFYLKREEETDGTPA